MNAAASAPPSEMRSLRAGLWHRQGLARDATPREVCYHAHRRCDRVSRTDSPLVLLVGIPGSVASFAGLSGRGLSDSPLNVAHPESRDALLRLRTLAGAGERGPRATREAALVVLAYEYACDYEYQSDHGREQDLLADYRAYEEQ